MIEAVAGVAAVVLAIVGLAGVFPVYLAAIPTIVIGAGLLFEGGALAAGFEDVLKESGEPEHGMSMAEGTSVEFQGGVAGVVLGILALIHIVPMVLMAVAAIAFGATLVMGSAATARIRRLAFMGHRVHHMVRRVASESVSAAAGGQTLVGLAAIVLGILGLVNFAIPLSLTLTLVALLCVGASVLLSGTAISGKVLSILVPLKGCSNG
jgi:hypothetical protein